MKKIISETENVRKQRRNKLIVGVVLIFLMAASILGFSFLEKIGSSVNSNKKVVIYHRIEFREENGLWIGDIGGLRFSFAYNPLEISDIFLSFPEELDIQSYYNQPLYIYSENKEAENEIARNLGIIAQRVQFACPDNEVKITSSVYKCEESWPVKNCDNNFIIISESIDNSVSKRKNCVFIDGKKGNLVKISNKFLFKIMNIE